MLCVRGYRGGERETGAEREENDQRITAAVIPFVRNMQHMSVIFRELHSHACGFPPPHPPPAG